MNKIIVLTQMVIMCSFVIILSGCSNKATKHLLIIDDVSTNINELTFKNESGIKEYTVQEGEFSIPDGRYTVIFPDQKSYIFPVEFKSPTVVYYTTACPNSICQNNIDEEAFKIFLACEESNDCTVHFKNDSATKCCPALTHLVYTLRKRQ